MKINSSWLYLANAMNDFLLKMDIWNGKDWDIN